VFAFTPGLEVRMGGKFKSPSVQAHQIRKLKKPNPPKARKPDTKNAQPSPGKPSP